MARIILFRSRGPASGNFFYGNVAIPFRRGVLDAS